MKNWSPSPDNLDLDSHHVDIWRVSLDLPLDSIKRMESSLSADEAERAARFHFDTDRHRFTIAHACLRNLLARYLACQPDQLHFSTNSYGKPALDENALDFNLSHSGDFALVAVTQGRKVGVDIERIRQGISAHVIARQYFSKSEVAELQALPLKQRETAFFACWTRKEAYIKAQGLGLSLPLEDFDVSLTPDEPVILRATRPDSQEAARWMLLSLDAHPEYASAVAVENTPNLEFRLWDWNPR